VQCVVSGYGIHSFYIFFCFVFSRDFLFFDIFATLKLCLHAAAGNVFKDGVLLWGTLVVKKKKIEASFFMIIDVSLCMLWKCDVSPKYSVKTIIFSTC